MRKMRIAFCLMVLGLFTVTGCGGDDPPGGTTVSGTPNLVMGIRISDTTGFLNAVDTTTATSVTNTYGAEIYPGSGVYAYNGSVYTTGSMDNDKVAKYSIGANNSLTKVAETVVYQSGGGIPSCLIFVDETKMYLTLPGAGQLLAMDPDDLTITKRFDLSAYALDASGNTGGSDTNPEPSGGVIRGGKLYLGLGQIDGFQTWGSRGKASVLIIDVATDQVLSHITDDRACVTGEIAPNNGLILDENGDIYVNNTASFGYYPGLSSGFLRIKNGEDTFDPDYFFSISGLENLDVPGGKASYAYYNAYLSEGRLYTTLFIPGLTSNPPDYVNDRNYQPYMLDLHNKTVTKLATPPTIGWSAAVVNLDGEIVYGLSTVNGTGLYRANGTAPFITTEGNPFIINVY